MTETTEKVKNLTSSCENSLNSFDDTFAKCSTVLSSVSGSHRNVMQECFEVLKSEQLHLKNILKKNISEILSSLSRQKASVADSNQKITNNLVENNSLLSTHTAEMKQKLEDFSVSIQKEFKEGITAINNITNKQKQLNIKKQNFLKTFLEQMKEVDAEEEALTNSMSTISLNLRDGEINITKTLNEQSDFVETFCDERLKHFEQIELLNKEYTEDATTQIELCSERLSDTDSHLDIYCNNNDQRMITLNTTADTDRAEIENLLSKYKQELDKRQSESKKDITDQSETICNVITESYARLKECTTQTRAFNASLKDKVRDYTSVYRDQMANCSKNLENFRQSELKTYSPTG